MKNLAKHIIFYFRWGVGIFSLLVGVAALLTGEIISSIFLVALGFLLTPLSNKYLFSKLKWRVPAWVKVILGFVLLLGFALTTSPVLSIEAASPTNQSPITVSVKYGSGEKVKLYLNDEEVGEKTTDSSGRAVFENIQLSEGDNNFLAEVTSEDKSTSRVIVYDTTPPDKPIVDLASEVFEKNLNIQGTSEANSTVKIYFNGNEARTIKANKDGEFSAKFLLSKPDNLFEFEAIDTAGNSSGLTEKIEVAFIDSKKLADEEKRAKQQANKVQKELEAAEKKRIEEEKKKTNDAQAKQQQEKDLTNLYSSVNNLIDLSDKANELVAASLTQYSALNISRATLYSQIKDAEAAQDKIWGSLVDLGNNTPESLKDYKEEITGFDGGMVYLQVAVKLRKEAMGELAKYIDTSSLQNMRNYETKLNEQKQYMTNGFLKLRSVGDKLGVELE